MNLCCSGIFIFLKNMRKGNSMERDREKIISGNSDREENNIRLDDSTDLAFDLDVFLRKNVYAYAEGERNCHEGMEHLADKLLSGQTANIHWWLKIAGGQEHLKDEAMALMVRVHAYEKEYGIPEPVRKAFVREQLGNAKKQVTEEKESKLHRKREMEK